MRRGVLVAAAACLLAGPTVLAFFSGGFFAEPRLIAAIVTWALVLALAIVGPAPLPRRLPGALALGGLVALTALTALSIAWAPLGGPAVASLQRLVLYVGALMLTVGVLRTRRLQRLVEPALALGATVVIAYGLSGRLLPAVVELGASRSAGGRLEQPITYWNAEGALAAIGLVLCARLAGDRSRRPAMRALAAAAASPLGAGVYLSYSRGAIAVCMIGMLVLVAAAPSRAQLSAAAVMLAAAATAAAVSAALPGVASLEGTARVRDGAIALAALVFVGAVAALAAIRSKAEGTLHRPRRLAFAAAAAVLAVAAGLVIGGLSERPSADELVAGAAPARLTTVSSNRYEYWRVGIEAFARHPLTGVGAGGFRVEWLRERSIREAVKDAHSLEMEIAAELGLAGLLAFVLMVAGVALAGRRALAHDPAMAAGACAALLTWFLHASIDWDWQLPAVSLPAVVLAGALIAQADRPVVTDAARSPGRVAAAP